ncbi:uncharacterized protein LOC143354838 [Halictus rubicundus]|uniref:uncharacterized protein LOC143354838 n=1 Tax=Halictus rubicundus TaxID=77578 RepID=UPI0040358244
MSLVNRSCFLRGRNILRCLTIFLGRQSAVINCVNIANTRLKWAIEQLRYCYGENTTFNRVASWSGRKWQPSIRTRSDFYRNESNKQTIRGSRNGNRKRGRTKKNKTDTEGKINAERINAICAFNKQEYICIYTYIFNI